MKIAIVAPSPVPFTIGGVENLIWGLCESINKNTIHQAEIIKLPSNENDFWSLIETYYNYYKLDLNHFDMVITTKYPSWMIQHNNSICYMIHTLRGLYDTYHFMNLSPEVKRGIREIDKILDYMENNKNINSLDEFFEMLFHLKRNETKVPKEYFQFPGPFIRKIIHFMDLNALSKSSVKNFYSISNTVKNRKEYFPENTDVKVVYPPSNLKSFSSGEYKYIFMVSRLDSPKRIDMLIRAMKYVKSNVKLLIAGTGPQEIELKKLAKGDDRVTFLGFVNDDEVEKYYANSLVIPYFPYDEDYGLITIEAMMHKKPVITTVDSGGPTEFVINGETGFITKFNEIDIANKIDYFANNPLEAKRMGQNAYHKVSKITWENVVIGLELMESNKLIKRNEKKKDKITVVTTFSIFPPLNGGQARIFNLYKNLATKFDIDLVTLASANQKQYKREIAEGMWEISIPRSLKHQNEEWEIEKNVGIPISDIGVMTLLDYTPMYEESVKKSIAESKVIILSHPYLYKVVKKYSGDKPIIYEAQDVEYEIKKAMYPKTNFCKKILQDIHDIESIVCKESCMIWTCSENDQSTLNHLYNADLSKMVTVPNGVDCSTAMFQNVIDRTQNKWEMGLSQETLAIFMGSWHKPNLEACEEIFKIAVKCPNIKFLIMGSQCDYFKSRNIPENIGMLGVVSEEIKKKIFSVVDFALNPMLSGSGTNLKMFDYMAAGIPIITTEFGTRGIDNKNLFIISEVENMGSSIQKFNLKEQDKRVLEAERYTRSNFDWCVIANKLTKRIQQIIN